MDCLLRGNGIIATISPILSLSAIAGSLMVAGVSERYPGISRHLDTIAGVLLISGLAAVGAAQAAFY